MRELCQLDTVFFAQQSLVVTSLPDIVDLNRLVALRGHTQLARIVVVDGQDVRDFAVLGFIPFEQLLMLISQWPPG